MKDSDGMSDSAARPPEEARPAGRAAGLGDSERMLEGIRTLHDRLGRLERLLAAPEVDAYRAARSVTPAWKRVTRGEPRLTVAITTAAAIALQLPLPGKLVPFRPTWVLPALQGLLFVILTVVNPRRIDSQSRAIRALALTLAAILSLANAVSAARLVVGLVRGTLGEAAGPLLVSGGAIWLTNVIVFALWYWEFDRGGPVARARGIKPYPDFQFVQMATPELAAPDWEPAFADYLYLAFTNATAFSPTDVMPLSRWAKSAMALQSAVSIITGALIVARAVNILK
jgi:uncharacterized membrane protein